MNHVDESFAWEEAGADRCLGWLATEHKVDDVSVKLRLCEWGFSDGPPKVFYGLASLSDLVKLSQTHGKQLFDKNIRFYLGGYPVNKSIAQTARNEPSHFVCFNNGITIVCESSSRPTAPSQKDAVFTLKSCSVVNGAQTIGAAIDASSTGALDPLLVS